MRNRIPRLVVLGVASSLLLGPVPVLAQPDPGELPPVEEEAPDPAIGEGPDRDLPDADLPDGDLPDGDLPDGDLPDRDLPDRDLPEGDL